MGFSTLGIGLGEGGGRIAASMVNFGANIACINTNEGDLNGLSNIPQHKKLLVNISSGGSGKDPNFVKSALQNKEERKRILSFIQKNLKDTPVTTICSRCKKKETIRDTEAVGDQHNCSHCGQNFGITKVKHEKEVNHDYIFLFACLGGGSGSGLIGEVLDIITRTPSVKAPIGVVCTLPDHSEDTTTKINAVSVFKNLYNDYAVKGIISPMILVDNQKMQESFDIPLGEMWTVINGTVTGLISKFNRFSNETSKYMSTVDTMDTARLWSLGSCCSMGKFIVGPSKLKSNQGQLMVDHPLALDEVESALKECTFVDGFDLSSAKGVGIIAVAPPHFLQDVNMSKCIKYAFGFAKEIIGDGLVIRGQYDDINTDCLEFYITYNGLKYPEERFEKMWDDIKEGKTIAQRKRNRIDEVPYDIEMESGDRGRNFNRLQRIKTGQDDPQDDYVDTRQVQVPTSRPKTPCDNCFLDPTTKKSMGVYNKRGPVPFESKICPVCKGSGKK